jgi:polyphosphate kinase
VALTEAAFEIGDEGSSGEVPPGLLLNPELSRLSFNERILAFAGDPAVPLLERVRFLGLVGDRLDDFFMSRVARFKRMVATGDNERTIDGLTSAEQLAVITDRANRITKAASGLLEALLPELAANAIHVERWASLTAEDRAFVRQTYGERIEASITPVIADPSRPFPHIRNLRPAVAVTGRVAGSGAARFIAIELPGDLPRFLPLADGHRLVLVEDAIAASLPELFPGLELAGTFLFRVTRSATMDIDDARDMMRAVELSVALRPFQEVVRLEVERAMPGSLRQWLLGEFRREWEELSALADEDVYAVDGLLDLSSLSELAALEKPELKFPPLPQQSRADLDRGVIDPRLWRDLLLRFPQDDFEQSVERFSHKAAEDPAVVRIAVTLYRTGKDSGIVEALRAARAKGKEVTAVIELKASFDEKENIAWARDLERDGIRVVLSSAKFKVHAKLGLIARRENEGVRHFAYIGTGNMNSATARTYVDFALVTTDPDLTREVQAVFDLLTGDVKQAEFKGLLVAPFDMRERFLQLIEREIAHARAGRPAGIRLHINGLADEHCIAALYRASQAGVRIDMMVRDLCALRPGVEGISDNIRVVSVVGRLLHHARIFHFTNGGADEYFMGSADWRPRNFKERVEVVTRISQPDHQAELDAFLTETLNADHAWHLRPNGDYIQGVSGR